MATKTKLEQAVERQAASLNDAQRELVRAQYATYKANRERMAEIRDRIAAIDAGSYHTMDEMRARQAEKSALAYEYGMLSSSTSHVASELSSLLKG